MEKYGVQFDSTMTKTAQAGECPMCGKKLDSGKACPDHGTEPLEEKNGKTKEANQERSRSPKKG
jgi:hypothetical protein